MLINAVKNITLGKPKRLYRPIGYTILANLIKILPFCLSIEIVNILFKAYDGSSSPLDMRRLWVIAVVLLIYITVMIWGERKSYEANCLEAYKASAEGRVKMAEHLRNVSLGTLYKKDASELSSMLITDFAMTEHSMSQHLPQFSGSLVLPIFAFLALLFADWRMALAMFVCLPLSCLTFILTSKLQVKLGGRQMGAKIKANTRMDEYLYGLHVIKAYNLVGKKFSNLQQAFANLKKTSIRTEALLGPIVMLCVFILRLGLTLMILCGVYLLARGDLSIVLFVLFLVVGSRVFDPLTLAFVNLAAFRFYSVAGEHILSFMKEPPMPGKKEVPLNGDISFNNVSFAYQEKGILHNLNITIEKGSLTAIVGPSGSGKSTIMKLCARFYDPTEGDVLLGNVSMRSMDPEKLMRRFSMVFQDVYLFQDTIRNNILFGKENATEEEIINAARKAQCHDFILKLPNGYDTMIGEGGNTLSGGEKQRISIARAILKDAPVILLDEATASLDPENEVAIQKALISLIKDRTVIVIAHKLKNISDADKIIVIEKGCVVEQGNHARLINKNGLYARLWDIQEKSCNWRVNQSSS